MARRMVNGKWVDLPDREDNTFDPEEVRQAAGIPDGRALMVQKPGGDNQMLKPGVKFIFGDGFNVIELPSHKRGR